MSSRARRGLGPIDIYKYHDKLVEVSQNKSYLAVIFQSLPRLALS